MSPGAGALTAPSPDWAAAPLPATRSSATSPPKQCSPRLPRAVFPPALTPSPSPSPAPSPASFANFTRTRRKRGRSSRAQKTRPMPFHTLKLTLDGALASITLDRPEKRNAISTEMIEELLAALDEAEAGPARVVILTGAGKAFCSGMDLDKSEER